MATNGINHDQYPATAQTTEANPNAGSKDLAKDEVGWYFVEQYYTTLSRTPEKLHLFYGKKSQFVYGQEAKAEPISVGRAVIQEQIKALDFSDCKVRISNVDSQGSDDNIVIQVIGEISNKAGEAKKFVQTFVLARQPSGYFVLNDILRYVDLESEEVADDAAAVTISEAPGAPSAPPKADDDTEPEAPAQDEPAEEVAPVELDAVVVDQKLEEVDTTVAETLVPTIESEEAEPVAETEEPTKEKAESIPDLEKAAEEAVEEEAKKLEEPKEPNPTPAVAAPTVRAAAPTVAEPEKPKEPPKPMTWASRAAAAAGPPRPVVPIPKTATPPAATQTRAPAPAAAHPTIAPQAAESAPAPTTAKDQGSEWQTAETKRQNRPQSISGAPTEKEGTMAYIKYVTEKVRDDDLRNALAGYGELAYFDINRQKNCAFVEFKTQAGYNAAVAANPHTVNGENIIVEQRRPKANAYGGSNYNATRGGVAGGRGHAGFDAGRTGNKGPGRGGFTGQTRGRGSGAPRGRGTSQAGAA